MTTIPLPDSEATEALGADLARRLWPGCLLLLEGPLGAGKTTLVRGVVVGLGGDGAQVCSPTFTLLATYEVARDPLRRVHHADLYRLQGRPPQSWDEIGLVEALEDPEGVTAVEWPGVWPWLEGLEGPAVRVRLSFAGEGREVVVEWSPSAGRR